jgi:hypothetical protein
MTSIARGDHPQRSLAVFSHFRHSGNSSPACSLTMYSAYQSGPVRIVLAAIALLSEYQPFVF